jgi:hypothetical protein
MCRGSRTLIPDAPESVDFVNQIHRTQTGKILKMEMRKKYWWESDTDRTFDYTANWLLPSPKGDAGQCRPIFPRLKPWAFRRLFL